MLSVEQILQLAEVKFWERQLRYDANLRRFYHYGHHDAVADALDEMLPGWKAFREFRKQFGQLHDDVLSSDHNDVYAADKDWKPSADQIADALKHEAQCTQYVLSRALAQRIPGFSAEIKRRGQAMRRANAALESRTPSTVGS